MKEAVAKFRDLIVANQGEVVYEEDWGLKKLAYPSRKKPRVLSPFRIQSGPDFIAKLELQYRRDERVIRYLTFAMDKHAIAYAEKKHGLPRKLFP
jgi:small subunit ribosomal protein S6